MSGPSWAPGSLLPAKLFTPLLEPDVLARDRLLDRLTAGQGAGLIVVSAPAGSGKTTLIANWVQRFDLPTGWVSLDPGDDDPWAFLGCFAEAVDLLRPGVCERARAMLSAAPPPAPMSIAQALVGEVTAAQVEGVIVLDDYHTISDPRIHEILAFVVERTPASPTLVVNTRSDPPLPLPRLRVRRQLCEIRAADLRFQPDEAAEFIRRFSGRELGQASIEALAGRTEGWAAGLQLAGLALRQAADPDTFVAGFHGTHAFVADYLTDEVLATIPAEEQQFVVAAALLDRFCAPLCDAALETTGSQERLEALCRANLFLVPLDAERRWFRFHHLFADLLRRRGGSGGEAERSALLIRAATWCEANSAADDAVRYAARAGDTHRAAELVAKNGVQALAAGHTFTARRWIERIPDEILESSPDHCLVRAMVHSLTEDYAPIARLAGLARELLGRGERPHPYVASAELHARWLQAAADAVAGADADETVAAFAAVWDESPLDDFPLRASAQLVTGNLLRLHGRYAAAEEANQLALDAALQAGSDLLRLAAITGIAENQLLRGDVQRAIGTASAELERPQRLHDVLGTQVANIASILALACFETGDLPAADHALRHARRAMGLPDEATEAWPPAARLGNVVHGPFHSSAPVVFYGLTAHVGLLLRAEERDAVRRCLETLEGSGSFPPDSTQRALLDSLRVRLLAATGDRRDLRPFAAWQERDSTGYRYWNDVRRLTAARAAIGIGDATTACTLLEPLLRELRRRGSPLGTCEAAVLHAFACSALGQRAVADRAADTALEATATQQRTRPWSDLGLAAVPLLERAVDRAEASSTALSHAAALLLMLREQNSANELDVLSERELAVLRLVAAGHSNQEIAHALFLAVGTVKKHTHNIYIKLDVSNRTQAAQVARERGLLIDLPAPPAE